jgi:hypothetical protein
MGRKHSFISSEFRGDDYDSSDDGEFIPDLVGVAMPFKGPECDEAYERIKGACKTLGLRPERVDEYSRSGVVLRDIAELIENAEFLIFDLSYERQNVYYELGYAHGVGNEASDILLVAREGTKLHYDISGLRVHFYGSLDELHRIIENNLKKMIETARE